MGAVREGSGGVAEEVCVFPLSFAQRRLWFLDQLLPGRSIYNVPATLRLCGALDRAALDRSLVEIVRRHESLRTTFASSEGQPLQVIHAGDLRALPVVDLRALPLDRRTGEALRLAGEESNRSFDLAHGSLLRTMLLCLDDHEHWLLITMHHIVSDGWSLGVLLSELSALYTAFRAEQPSPLPELPIQYADYAVWQRDWLRGEVLAEQVAYWKQQLADLGTMELPADRPRPEISSFRGAHHRFVLAPRLCAALKAFSQQEGVTLFMLLLAAWQTLLHRYSGQEDIAVGTPVAGRTHQEIEGLIGFFVNTLVLRARLNSRMRFRDLLQQVRGLALHAYAHQHLPFEMLVDEVQPRRDVSRNPLFQVMFQLQEGDSIDVPQLSGLEVEFLAVPSETVKFDLILELWSRGGQLRGALKYSTDLFEASTIRRMTAHFTRLLEGIVDQPDQQLSLLPLLTADEEQGLVTRTTAWHQPPDLCVHTLVEVQVARTPDAVAVEWAEERITYRQLNDRANVLAHQLRELGAGPEVHVGICMARTPEMLVALLAILKAGAAYVPLDPQAPAERLRFTVADAEVVFVLSEPALAGRLPHDGPPVLVLDGGRGGPMTTAVNPLSRVRGDNVAYLMYTSGSTGRPKGVVVTHRGVVNYLRWINDLLGKEPAALPAVTSLTFDASLKQLLAPLIRGDRVWLLPEDIVQRPAALLHALAGRGRVGFNGVPALWQVLLAAMEAEAPPPGFTTLLLGGDTFTPRLIARTRAVLPAATIWNLYGPTEATANASAALIKAGEPITIGHPVANVQAYVLDTTMQISPIGVAGEIYLGGAGLARGYHRRAGLTAEQFVPHPYSEVPGARLYRTGDRGRYRPDGAIEFLGRVDRQIKLDGLRIELGEIEAVLHQHADVREAIAVVREVGAGHRQIVAAVTLREGAAVDGMDADLRQFLRHRLPAYMVPAACAIVPELPLNVHGKIDHSAVAQLAERHGRETAATGVAALLHGQIERSIAAVWRDVLHVEEVGRHDNFFDLGGRSLLLVEVHSRLQGLLPRPVALIDLFHYPTVGSLAAFVSQTRGDPATSGHRDARARRRRQAIGRQGRASGEEVRRERYGG